MTRREFIGFGSAGLGWLGGARLFAAAPGVFTQGRPLLKFGVVSDIHFAADFGAGARKLSKWNDETTFVHALEYFRDAGVDAVMVAGDMADNGLVRELEAVGAAWFKVFPNDQAPDGRHVEKLFCFGNHDVGGFNYGNKDRIKALWPDEAQYKRELVVTDRKGNWEHIFREPFADVAVKTVKGYAFIGSHWGTGDQAVKAIAEAGAKADPAKPFFFFQHPHPRDTVYGHWAWGHDNGKVTDALSAFPNAVAFSGHSHYSLADERSVWQGAFTSFGTASLRYIGQTYDEFYPEGLANSNAPSGRLAKALEAEKIGPRASGASRQGMVISVYADRLVAERRDFAADLSMGDDWVMPLPQANAARPYRFAPRKAAARAPQFPADAAAAVKAGGKGKTRGGVEKDVLSLTFPAANATAARPYVYEVGAETKDGSEIWLKRYLAESYLCSKADRRYAKPMTCWIRRDELPAGEEVRFVVRPMGWFGTKGKAIASAWTAG